MSPAEAPTRHRVGLIVNPIAGIGGRVGLKGSDGADALRRSLALGGVSEAGDRARRTLEVLRQLAPEIELIVAPSEMGETPARAAGFDPCVVGMIVSGATTAADTRSIAAEMRTAGIELLLFAGGDGTARDVCDAVGRTVTVLGIAAGVKVYSAVFAINPARAGELAGAFLHGRAPAREGEVLDLDEDAYRAGRVSPTLHGYVWSPFRRDSVQGGKEPTPAGERPVADAIADDIVEHMSADRPYILGPGTTTHALADRLGLPKTLVGVDVVTREHVMIIDANEMQLRELVETRPATIVVTPIGGQGFLFGRGNPQIGPRVIACVNRRDIIVVATPTKLAALQGRPLLVDTGDPTVDASLIGYLQAVTGYHERTVYRVSM
jgi:predicted polyphosphate/ATP-dependent NAD kinase